MKTKYLIRKMAMGDVLWIEPLIRQLSAKYKKLYVCTGYTELFENYPLKNVVFKRRLNFIQKLLLKFERKSGRYTRFIDLDMCYERSPKMHILKAYSQKAEVGFYEEYPKLYLSDTEKAINLFPKPHIILHIESFSDRNFRKVYGINWEIIVACLQEKGFEVVVVGKNPENIGSAVLFKGTTRELISVINKCTFFIGIDSGPSHIAAALGKPSLIFFGAINPLYRHFPSKAKIIFLQQTCEYSGCYHEAISENGQPCKLVGNEGIPKCCVHSNEYVITNIDTVLNSIADDKKVAE